MLAHNAVGPATLRHPRGLDQQQLHTQRGLDQQQWDKSVVIDQTTKRYVTPLWIELLHPGSTRSRSVPKLRKSSLYSIRALDISPHDWSAPRRVQNEHIKSLLWPPNEHEPASGNRINTMGNKPFRLALKLDQITYQAGDLVKGRVFVSIDSASSLDGVDGLYLRLEGYEYAQVSTKTNSHNSSRRVHDDRHRRIERSTNTLVRTEHRLVRREDLKVGQYDMAFEWRLPSDLPSSMQCQKKDSSSLVEIRYTLTAFLSSSGTRDLPHSDAALCIAARPLPVRRESVLMETENFPVHSCFFWNNGDIRLGWIASSDVAVPGDSVTVEVFGENQSPQEVDHLSVKWIETVTWTTDGGSKRKSVTRTLAEQRLNVANVACWRPWYKAEGSSGYQSLASHRNAQTARLSLPMDARDSYNGRLVQVRHSLVVKVATKGCVSNSPESSFLVRIVRGVTTDLPSSAPMPSQAPVVPAYAEAEVLSWDPVLGEVIEVPEAAAVLIDEDLMHMRTEAVAHVSSSAQFRASAPEESLLHEQEYLYTPYARPDLAQLITLVQDSPSSLSALLQDATWITLVQNLSPREFCAVLQAAGPACSLVARTVARTMRERFECRHLLACLWTLPENYRMDLLQQTAPFLGDLTEGRRLIEQELSPRELACFRAALSES